MALIDGFFQREVVGAATVRVPVRQLQPGDSVRLGGTDAAHLEVLIELDGAWPPLLITPSGRILDGHYRHLAARRLGLREVECTIFEGDEAAGLVEAVRRNSSHGLPLTLAERRAAATRVLVIEPAWSDRRVAAICGLAHETVGRLRRQLCADGTISLHERRLGRDGALRSLRRRPAEGPDSAEGDSCAVPAVTFPRAGGVGSAGTPAGRGVVELTGRHPVARTGSSTGSTRPRWAVVGSTTSKRCR